MIIDQNNRIEDIATLLSNSFRLNNPATEIKYLSTDTRTISVAPQTLFFALKAQQDGHQFLSEAYQKGVRNFVVSIEIEDKLFREANFIFVENTLLALQQLAVWHRNQFDIPVIGITGSNGKTVVKEWLYQMLHPDYNIVRSPKSYNSQIGVPLSVWQIAPWHDLGIFEVGISKLGEMEALAPIVHPSIGVLTNIGEAHDEGFESKEAKLTEKMKLFSKVDCLVYGIDNPLMKKIDVSPRKAFTWGFAKDADLKVLSISAKANASCLLAIFKGAKIGVEIPFSDAASIENAFTCWATLLAMGYENEQIAQRMKTLNKIEMRLQLLHGIDQCSIIDDSYSADLSSLSIALDFLNQQNQHAKRSLILSDFAETRRDDEKLYTEVAQLIEQKGVNRFIGVGEKLARYAYLFAANSDFFPSTEALLAAVSKLSFYQETILIKGARKFEFEKVVSRLTQKTHETVLSINLNALLLNYQFYRSKLAKGVKVMAMVKAFSYGSGSFEIANLLQYHQVDYLAVAYADEGIALRKAGILLPIMVMSPEPTAFDAMIRYNLEPEVYSVEMLTSLTEFLLENHQDTIKIHLKLDTGMHRLGVENDDIDELKRILTQFPLLIVESIFTHLVASENLSQDDFTRQQIQCFERMYQSIVDMLPNRPLRHVLNTSGISRWAHYQFDMVRLGIGLYGFDSVEQSRPYLQTVASLSTTISQIKQLKADDTVGYGRQGVMETDGKIATVKIGYADGYSRAFGNGVGRMLIGGKLVSTLGAICMDMCMLDVTNVDAEVGDKVVVFNEQLDIQELATAIDTIAYEILTNVSQRVKRVYYYE